MRPLIKICGLTDEAAIDAAIAAGAGALGFVFADSVRRVSAQHAAKISAHVPPHIKRVAVMLHPDAAEWREVASIFQPDILQTDIADFAYLDVADDVERWPVFREGQVSASTEWPELFVYEGRASGAGQTVDWQLAAQHARCGNMVLAGGLDSSNVTAAIRAVLPFGVDVSSGVEAAPGKKDVAMIRAFGEAVQAAGMTAGMSNKERKG